MKIRTDFVTNSSSSSFIVIAKNKSALKTSVTIPVDFNDLTASEVIKSKKDVNEYIRDHDLNAETAARMLSEIEKGNSLFKIHVSSEDDSAVSRYIHETTEGDYEDVQRLLPGLVILKEEYDY
jgi:hypothetical protein